MKTLIILGHPDKNSFSAALASAYEEGAREKGGEVVRMNLIDLDFDPILRHGYNSVQKLEPDLVEAQRLIKWADRIVFVFPIWWSAHPALLKGFIDRVFLPGFAFQYREHSVLWDKLLQGKSARLITTSDTSSSWSFFSHSNPVVGVMKKSILEFCGITPVAVTNFGAIKKTSSKKREILLDKAYREGLQDH